MASIGMGVYRWWQQKRPGWPGGGGGGGAGRPAPAGGPKSPPAMQATTTPEQERELVGTATAPRPSLASLVQDSADTSEAQAWVEPLDGGACPSSHPIKANDNSGIYHVPGGRFYDRTVAVRCYADPESATADGYRPAKA
jgi:hypothetical protein